MPSGVATMDSACARWSRIVMLELALLLLAVSILAEVPGLRFDRQPESRVVLPGSEVVLECALNVSADRYEWKLNGNPLPSTANRASGRLVIQLSENEDEYKLQTGTYQCVAWFGASAMASLPAEVQVAHIEEPKTAVNSSSVRVTQGNVISLSFPVPKSNPPAQLHCKKDGQPISGLVSHAEALLLANVKPSDSGRYTCTATNSLTGQTVSLPFNYQLTVEPLSQRNIAPYLAGPKDSSYSVVAGKDAILECMVGGSPPPKFTWSKYGGSLPEHRAAMLPGALLISGVTQADEGTYICEAQNTAGPAASSIISLHVNEPPTIIKEPPNLTGEEGGDVQLRCAIRGSPTPTIQWLLNGESVDRDPHVTTQGRVLNITRVEKRHAGIYQCFATNALGSAFGVTMLQVKPKTINSRPLHMGPAETEHQAPERGHNRGHKRRNKKPGRRRNPNQEMIPPTSPNITRLSDESVMVTWDVPENKGLAISFFKVQYKELVNRDHNKDQKESWNTIDDDIHSHVRSYQVDNLKTNHQYKFRISAVYSNNDNKQGPDSTRFLLEKEPTMKKPMYAPTITDGEAASTSAIKITWEYTPVASVPVEGFFIHYRSTTMAGEYTKASAMGEDTRSFLITHLLPDNSYDIKIQAFNSAGTSGFSDTRSYRTLYVATTEEPASTPPMPGGGGFGSGMAGEVRGQPLGLVLGIVFGSLLLLLMLLCLGVYLCKHSNTRTAASDHDPAKEAQAYGLVAVGKPITNGTGHHLHQIRHGHRHPQRVHITSNPLASAADHYKSETELELPSQNNNCSDPSRRRLRTTSVPSDEASETPDEIEGSSEEEMAPPVPPRQMENYV